MCQAIASAYDVDEVKDIRDRAAALEHYSRQAHNVEAERQCCEIRLRAERKAGQLLKQREQPRGNRYRASDDPTLKDLGVSPDQSSQWQKLADIPGPQFEAALAGPVKPTTNGIIQSVKPAEITPVSDDALWFWGRLCEFKRHEVLNADPQRFLATMTPQMLADVDLLAPQLGAWLKRIGGDDGA
jgi:hypothetical protein